MPRLEPTQADPPDGENQNLPELLRPLFWDCDFDRLRWDEHRDFIAGRILISGTWDTVQWLRLRVGEAGVRTWILDHRGRGLSPQQLRFWELILDLPTTEVDRWLAARESDPWHRRLEPRAAEEPA